MAYTPLNKNRIKSRITSIITMSALVGAVLIGGIPGLIANTLCWGFFIIILASAHTGGLDKIVKANIAKNGPAKGRLFISSILIDLVAVGALVYVGSYFTAFAMLGSLVILLVSIWLS